jgi:hypothetical protein
LSSELRKGIDARMPETCRLLSVPKAKMEEEEARAAG